MCGIAHKREGGAIPVGSPHDGAPGFPGDAMSFAWCTARKAQPLYIGLTRPVLRGLTQEQAMDPHFSDATASSARIAGAAVLRLELQQEAEEDRLAAAEVRPRRWPLVVAILALVAMLLVFYQVVRGSLQKSELRQEVQAEHAEALWRCNSLQGREVSDSCHLRANAKARGVVLVRSPDAP